MNFLCPACRTSLPTTAPGVVACAKCGVEVDLTRVDTAPGQARLWPEVDLAGEQLGAYRLGARAGSGGMGTVYEAQGPEGRCAVKVLTAAMAADPALRERFRREAQALRQLRHPHVVRMLDEGQDRGFCWYAMEYVEGSDLRARLEKGALPASEVETLARQLLSALDAVHGASLVHRDVKPANILLSPHGARLCDFGIARVDGATTLTESAALLGSLRYMAPEQRAGVSSVRADLYSLGVVLREALGFAPEVEGQSPSVPRRLERLLEALLQVTPARRPASAAAALALLEPSASGKWIALAAAAVLLFGAGAWWGLTRAPDEGPTATEPPDAGTLVAVAAPAVEAPAPLLELDGGEDAGAPDASVDVGIDAGTADEVEPFVPAIVTKAPDFAPKPKPKGKPISKPKAPFLPPPDSAAELPKKGANPKLEMIRSKGKKAVDVPPPPP